jgi:aminoglycoside phosphotransferase (APT) family kinase protein
VRLPSILGATGQVEKEHRWLPRLAPFLPLAIPVPIAKGTPAEGYPWPWSVYRWFEGETATIDRIADPRQAATELAQFLAAPQQIDPSAGRSLGSTTPSAACRWQGETPKPATRSRPYATGSMPTR